ncbi:MAG: diguanylate cyclase [Nitrospirae bacterium]|nr:diguanylate cyclase [Nitrospirota bacterium]
MSFDINKAVLANIFAHSSDCIFILDKEWKIVDMNQVAEAVSGWRKSEVVSMHLCTELFICYDKDGSQLCDGACPKVGVVDSHKSIDMLDIKISDRSGQPFILPGLAVHVGYNEESYAAILIKNEIDSQLLEERLLSLERLDPLTQLYHRQYFEDLYNIEARRLQRHGGTIALLMLDVEGLRELNIRYGHRIGDDILRGIGKVIKMTVREVDIASRYGNDEYVILLYGVDEAKGQAFVHRLRENILKWNQTENIPCQVKLNMCFLIEDREFQSLLEKIKNIIDERKGVPL